MNCPICEMPLTGEKDVTGFQYCDVCRIGKRDEGDVPKFDYSNAWVKEHDNPETIRRMKWHVKQIRKVIKYYGDTLDIGCGSGVFVELLSKYYYAWGTDKSESALWYCFYNSVGNFTQIENLPGDCFDIVTILQVLEHIPSPAEFINEIKNLLRPTGYLYIEVPNTDQPLAMSAKGTDHRLCFTIRSLTELLKQNGFKIIHTRTLTLSENIAVNVINTVNKASKYVQVPAGYQKLLNYTVKKIRASGIVNLLTLPRRIALDRKQQGYNIVCLAQKQ